MFGREGGTLIGLLAQPEHVIMVNQFYKAIGLKRGYMEETIKDTPHTSPIHNPILNTKGGVTSWGNTYTLLCEGKNPSQTAKQQGLSRKTIHKRIKFYLDTGKIEKIAWGIYRTATKKECNPPLKPVALVTQAPTMVPHKFGGIFAQTGIPNLRYDERGKAEEKTVEYCAQFGRHKTQIWLKNGFIGASPDEQIRNGQIRIEMIARDLAKKYRITLKLLRFYTDIEWVDISKERSKASAKAAGMKKKQRVEIADAIHVLDGTSQNDLLEIDKAPGKPNETPTDHARIRHALYSGEYERRFDMVMRALEKMTMVFEEVKIRMDIKEDKTKRI